MDPHHEQQNDRNPDVHEHEEGEEPIVQALRRQEIARDGLAENGEPIQKLGTGDRDLLGEFVPNEPIARDARGIEQPDNR